MEKTDNSLFKGQYIIGPRYVDDLPGWQNIPISESLYLTAHPGLEVTIVTSNNNYFLCLGYVFHPDNPEWDNEAVINYVANNSKCFTEFEETTSMLCGRWIIFITLNNESRIYPDTMGSRPIFYSNTDKELWIGNQPSIIGETLALSPNQELIDIFRDTSQPEMWPGALTPYSEIKHMAANHYLDIKERNIYRFWPTEDTVIESIDIATAAQIISKLLSGTLQSASNRYELWIALTAGADSRTLLATSREINSKIKFFTIEHSKIFTLDLSIPKKLANDLKLNYKVIQRLPSDDKFLEIFDRNTANMVTGNNRLNALTYDRLPSNAIFAETQGSEIGRCYYYQSGIHPKSLSPNDLCNLVHFSQNPVTLNALEEWLDGLPKNNDYINRLDLFLWEQRGGNWTAMDFTGQELTRQVFSAFNNRKLITTMLGIQTSDRCESHLHRYICKLTLPPKHTKYFNTSRLIIAKKLPKRVLKKIISMVK